ncbi:hypothetical protein [Prosthecobacter sp.]|uniref:hypothetical protein n=1 Tax=Prosthecobacter sp. TaxID=1965333 RepID=UPI003784251C
MSDLIQKGIAATTSTTDRKAAEAALTQAGLSPEGIAQMVNEGRLSVQDGQLLNGRLNSGRAPSTIPPAGTQGFGAWITDESNPRSAWWRHGTDEQKAVAVHENFDDLAAGRAGDGNTPPDAIENMRRQALGDIRPEWGKPGAATPGQDRQNGAARFESIPLKDGGHTLLPGGKWTVEDLEKLHENPTFAKATQAQRDAVMNDIIGQSFADYSQRPGFDQAAYQRFNQIAQQARDRSAALKTWADTGSEAKDFAGNVVGGVARPIIATATDLSAKDPDGEWRAPLGNVAEQAGYWFDKAGDTGAGFLPWNLPARWQLGNDLEALHQDLLNGSFPLNDRARLDEWLAARSKALTQSQKAWYEAVQGRPDTSTDKGLAQHIYTHANSLLNPVNAELVSRFIQTRDPAVWDELHHNLTRTPQRAETEQAQKKSLEDSKIVNFMTQNYGGGDYAEPMKAAGNPLDIASNVVPMVRGLRAGKAATEAAVLAGKSALKGSAAAMAKSILINLGTGGLQTLVENPDATFAELAQAGKENIATALGLHAAGHVAGKAKALVTDLNDAYKARQVIDKLGAPNRQNTFREAVQLHEAENTLAAAQKANLEKKKSAGGTLTSEESSTLDKANATLARHAPRNRGPLPAIPDARRTIQDLSKKEASGPLNADDAHSLADARRAIAQQRVNDLLANKPLSLAQQRELDRFREILAASPYGTELPKGPPPGYDPRPRAPIPGKPPRQHHEWYPIEGDKPVHPSDDKFTPDALAIPDSEIKDTMDRLKANGHAHDRHGPEVTEGQLSDRAMHKVDPITQTKEDGEKSGKNHRAAIRSTQFTSERSMTQAVKAIENSNEYRDNLAKAVAEGDSSFVVENVSLESALGPDYLDHVRGRTRDDSPRNHVGHRPTILKAGKIFAHYKKDPATGQFYLNTMYPTHSPLYERD